MRARLLPGETPIRPSRPVLIQRGLREASLTCACVLQTSRGQALAVADFSKPTLNVAEASAKGYELEVVISPQIAICSNCQGGPAGLKIG